VSVEAERVHARARVLCEQVGEAPQRLLVLAGLCVISYMRGETNKAMDLAEQLFDLARETHHSPHLMMAHVFMAEVSFWRGDFCAARHHGEEAIRLYEPGLYGEYEYLSAFVHAQVAGLSYLSVALFALGYPEQALTRCRQAVALARELSHPFSEATALLWAGFVHSMLRACGRITSQFSGRRV